MGKSIITAHSFKPGMNASGLTCTDLNYMVWICGCVDACAQDWGRVGVVFKFFLGEGGIGANLQKIIA